MGAPQASPPGRILSSGKVLTKVRGDFRRASHARQSEVTWLVPRATLCPTAARLSYHRAAVGARGTFVHCSMITFSSRCVLTRHHCCNKSSLWQFLASRGWPCHTRLASWLVLCQSLRTGVMECKSCDRVTLYQGPPRFLGVSCLAQEGQDSGSCGSGHLTHSL